MKMNNENRALKISKNFIKFYYVFHSFHISIVKGKKQKGKMVGGKAMGKHEKRRGMGKTRKREKEGKGRIG